MTHAVMKEHDLNLKLKDITGFIEEFNRTSRDQLTILEDQVTAYKEQMVGRVLVPELQAKYDELVVKMDTNIVNIKARLEGNMNNLNKIENAGSIMEKATILQTMEEQLNAYNTRE